MVILYTTRKAKNKEMITDNIIILPTRPCMPFNIPEARSLLLIAADKEFNFSKIEGQNIEEFTEKPDRNKALEFIKDKRYTWNSGMFMFKAKKIYAKKISSISRNMETNSTI